MNRRAFAIGLAASLTIAADARALDAEVEATTIGQFYGLRAWNGDTLDQQRVSQYLRLNLYNVASANRLFLVTNLRLDTNFGITAAEVSEAGTNDYRRGAVTLLTAYLAGRGLFGFLDFGVGRQLAIDSLDYFVYDGLRVALNTPWYFGVEIIGGVQVRGNSPIGYSAFQPWGTLESEEAEVAPVFGVALYARDVRFAGGYRTEARVSWRRVFNGAVVEERIGGHAEQLIAGALTVAGGATYNLVFSIFDEITAGARLRFLGARANVGVEYFRANPRFDADSIWNVFSYRASDDIRAKVGYEISPRLEAFARGLVRLFHQLDRVETATTIDYVDSAVADIGGGGGLRLLPRHRGHSVAVELGGEFSVQQGFGGDRIAVDAYSIVSAWERRLAFDARVTFVNLSDDNGIRRADLPTRSGNYLGLLVGASYRILRGTSLGIQGEAISNDTQTRFRLYLALESSLNFWDDPVDMNRARRVGTTP